MDGAGQRADVEPLCEGCLSRRRAPRLSPAAQRLYCSLLDDSASLHLISSGNVADTILCWECAALLQKTLRFKQQARRAQQWLWATRQQDKRVLPAMEVTMSSLKCSKVFECTVKSEYIEIPTETVDMKFEEDAESNANEGEPYEGGDYEIKSEVLLESRSRSPDVKQILKIEHGCVESFTDKTANTIRTNASIEMKKDTPPKNTKKERTSKETKELRRLPGQMFEKVLLNEQEFQKMRHETRKNKYFVSAAHKCDTCLTGFVSQTIYQRHISKYHALKSGRHICKICDKRHRKKLDLDNHIKEHYTCYKCRVCEERFLDRQISYRHYLRVHTGKQMKYKRLMQVGEMYATVIAQTDAEVNALREEERKLLWYQSVPYKCESCIKGFISESKFKCHQSKYHSSSAGNLVCSICDARLHDKELMVKHLASHYRSYKCNECAAKFSLRLTAYRHYLNVHKLNKSYKCTFCTLKFEKRFERRDHIEKMHNTFPCPKCGKEFKYQKVYQQHVESHCSRLCVHCGRKFATRGAHRAHVRTHHPRPARPDHVYCVECDKQFRSRSEYSHHISVKHTYADRMFACTECDRTFTRKLVMKNHYNMVHLDKKNFQCEQCQKFFVNGGVLNRHKKFVHERQPKPKKHVCDICSRAFSGKSILDNHRRTHTGERPFMCHYCSAAFAQKVALHYHVKRIHLKGGKGTRAEDKL